MAASLWPHPWDSGCLTQTNSKAPSLEVSNQGLHCPNILNKKASKASYLLDDLLFDDTLLTCFRVDFEGGIKLGEMLFRTNIIGFVGTGKNSNYPSNRLILWDDIQHRPFGELNF